MPKRRTQEEVVLEIQSEDYTVLQIDYKNQKSKILVKHNLCGNSFLIDHDHWHNRRQRCPKCNKESQKKTHSQFLEKLSKLGFRDKYEILSEYTTKRNKIKVRCLECGNVFEILPENMYTGNCAYCAANARRKKYALSLEDVKKIIIKDFKEYELVSDSYINNKTNIRLKCKKCNTEFSCSLTNLRGGSRCPLCYASTSKPEEEIKDFLEKNGIETKKAHKKFGRRRLEIDLFTEKYNIGIEFNGLYWHSEQIKGKSNMKEKMDLFQSNGVRIINVFEDEWTYKRKIVEDKLLSIFGMQKDKIYARKCVVKNITPKEKNQFLDENHIQGKDVSSINMGMFFENNLVAVMTLSKLRKNLGFKSQQDGVYELSRFAGKIGYTIVGGFSKLLSNCIINNEDIREIITYGDLRWTSESSNVYSKNGFILTHKSQPSYSYLDNNCKKRLNRFSYRKDILKEKFPEIYSDKKTEFQIMDEAGFKRIWDCGNLVFKKTIKR